MGWSVKVTGLASCVGVNVLGWSVKVTGLASCGIGWGNVLGWFIGLEVEKLRRNLKSNYYSSWNDSPAAVYSWLTNGSPNAGELNKPTIYHSHDIGEFVK